MEREFDFFDRKTVEAELDSLPPQDAAKLLAVMQHYEKVGLGDPYPAQIDAYEDGILRIRHAKSKYQGRALFYISASKKGWQRLTVLTVFKKEGQKTPPSILERARKRMNAHKKKKQ